MRQVLVCFKRRQIVQQRLRPSDSLVWYPCGVCVSDIDQLDEAFERLFLLSFPAFTTFSQVCQLLEARYIGANDNIIQQERVIKFLSRWIKLIPHDFEETSVCYAFLRTFRKEIALTDLNASTFLSKSLRAIVCIDTSTHTYTPTHLHIQRNVDRASLICIS
jgi:hypothetical protein